MLKLDLSNLEGVVSQQEIDALAPELEAAHAKLYDPAAPGADFTGWVRLPENYDKEEFARIQKAAAKIRKDSQVLVVIGIGGSYLGARGVIDCLCSPNYNLKKKSTPNVYFVGNGLSADAMQEVLDLLDGAVGEAELNAISINGSQVQVQFSGVTLAQTAGIVSRLEESPLVAATWVNTAATTQDTGALVQSSILIQLQKEETAP